MTVDTRSKSTLAVIIRLFGDVAAKASVDIFLKISQRREAELDAHLLRIIILGARRTEPEHV